MAYIRAGLNQRERKLIGYRTRKALAHKKDKGERISRYAPFGYHFENGMVVEDLHEQRIITRIMELRKGGYTIRAIKTKLESESLLNRKKKPIGRNEIWTIVKKAA